MSKIFEKVEAYKVAEKELNEVINSLLKKVNQSEEEYNVCFQSHYDKATFGVFVGGGSHTHVIEFDEYNLLIDNVLKNKEAEIIKLFKKELGG